MPKINGLFAVALFSVSITGAGLAQTPSPPAHQDMQHTMPMQGGPMQGGMCGPSGCGMGAPAQSTPMRGMM
jgi:hypothetical protein